MNILCRMIIIINNNISAINSQRTLKFKNWDLGNNMRELSSGLRIKQSWRRCFWFSILKKCELKLEVCDQAERRSEDGVSFYLDYRRLSSRKSRYSSKNKRVSRSICKRNIYGCGQNAYSS